MKLNEAIGEFLTGYCTTYGRRRKTETAYRSDLAQFLAFAVLGIPPSPYADRA
jgi:hypothetical protein